MVMRDGTIVDSQWYETKSDSELAQYIAGQSPKAADAAIRDLNQHYRAAKSLNFGLDPVNMIPINPVGELLNQAFDAVSGARPPLTAAEIEPVVKWIRAQPRQV